MSFEIEQKYRCADHEFVVAKLESLGATASPTIAQEDTYLSHPARDFAQSGEALRVRRSGDHNAITYKGPRHEGPTKTRRELEIPFQSGPPNLDKLRQLFEALGFEVVMRVRKSRTPYHLSFQGRPLEIVLDDAEGLGTFVEVEAIAEGDGDVASAQNAVVALSLVLGLTELEPRSYLRMALERRAALGDG